MISGSVERLELLQCVDQPIVALIEEAMALADKGEMGKIELSMPESFVIITYAETKPLSDCKCEYHDKYMDVQILLEGKEIIGHSLQKPETDHKLKNDVAFIDEVSSENFIELSSNEFAIFPPRELHRPLCKVNDTLKIKKAIVKVPIN
ncbi:YhcH/YjgK/YiaL family protein [Vibrio algivorus]|uniref:DUF386 domain-containing protein n=1 Tax=Vibrio algivorus TaxID=1667024 RepID=A0ABQ6EQP8_9VIBR|nr:YhcH/YjgK/YiaL family protein [Vibrio algivorus]GLT15314.1 hypothetical protein GCM10007931_22890 [Vibrio algivorus]